MKRFAAVLVLLVLCISLLAGCSALFGSSKSEKQIMEDIGEDITVFLLDDERIQLYVEDLEIEKRKTEDDLDKVYCKIKMTNDNISVTTYQLMTYVKYNGNEWLFEQAIPYEEEEVEILEPTSQMYDKVIKYIVWYTNGGGIMSDESVNDLANDFESMIDTYSVACNGRFVEYVFEVSKTVGVANTTGTIYATSEVCTGRAGGYYTAHSVENSNLSTKWNVEGKWYGEENYHQEFNKKWYGVDYNEKEIDSKLTVEINALTSESIDCSWKYETDLNKKKSTSCSGDSGECTIFDQNDEYIEVRIDEDGSSAALVDEDIFIYFYTDGTAKVHFPYRGTWAMLNDAKARVINEEEEKE